MLTPFEWSLFGAQRKKNKNIFNEISCEEDEDIISRIFTIR